MNSIDCLDSLLIFAITSTEKYFIHFRTRIYDNPYRMNFNLVTVFADKYRYSDWYTEASKSVRFTKVYNFNIIGGNKLSFLFVRTFFIHMICLFSTKSR